MEIFQIAVIAIITVMLTLTLKKDRPELALVLSISGGLVILIMIVAQLVSVIPQITSIAEKLNLPNEYFEPLIKIVGIAYISEFAVGTCKDAGENALAAKVELGGKILIIVVALPIVIYLFELLTGLVRDGI